MNISVSAGSRGRGNRRGRRGLVVADRAGNHRSASHSQGGGVDTSLQTADAGGRCITSGGISIGGAVVIDSAFDLGGIAINIDQGSINTDGFAAADGAASTTRGVDISNSITGNRVSVSGVNVVNLGVDGGVAGNRNSGADNSNRSI